MSINDYTQGLNDALAKKSNRNLSALYNRGYTEGLAKLYYNEEQDSQQEYLLEKHEGIYVEERKDD